jgi:hypothetical protein
MTVNTRLVGMILAHTELPYLVMDNGKRLQIVPDFDALPFCQRHQSAAFVKSHQLLVVWEEEPKMLLERAEIIIDTLVDEVWGKTFYVTDKSTGEKMEIDVHDTDDQPVQKTNVKPRRMPFWQTCYTAAAICLMTTAIGSGWRQVAIEQVHDPNWTRLLFMLAMPVQAWLSLVRSRPL